MLLRLAVRLAMRRVRFQAQAKDYCKALLELASSHGATDMLGVSQMEALQRYAGS